MKNKNKIWLRSVMSLLVGVVLLQPTAAMGDIIEADDFADGFPYTKTYAITAYYSPLPCQEKYAMGSYDAEIRMNGSGVNSADGTPVYPGMVAAPKSYPFGTKMYIPGIGIVAVHDRGGAIVHSGEKGESYDRLDIWMGYGDKGLRRALSWGKRTVDVTVYGFNDSITEQISLEDYSPDEAVPNECVFEFNEYEVINEPVAEYVPEGLVSLARGSTGEKVRELQVELKNMNFLRSEVNGVYDEVTEHAVFKFQQSQGIVVSSDTLGAGVFGPKTRGRLSEIVASRNYNEVRIAQATKAFFEEDDTYVAVAE